MNTDLLNIISKIANSGLQDLGSLHPALVHFPIGLLFVTPLFVILGLILPKHKQCFHLSALILLIIGTITLLLAFEAGEKAADALGKINPETLATLEQHDKGAESLKLNFIILTVCFTLYSFFHKSLKKLKQHFWIIASCLFLAFYGYSLILVINTAHYGGKLVHQHGLKSSLYNNVK